MYGRFSGRHIPLYDASTWSPAVIPEAGFSCNCEALLPSTMYQVYAYDHEGTLFLDVTGTSRGGQDGIEVKSDDPSRRFVGVIGVDQIQTGYQGPVDTPDARLVRNRYNVRFKELSKDPNYTSYTRADHFGNTFARLNNNDDFKMRFVSWHGETILFMCTLYVPPSYYLKLGVAVDHLCPQVSDIFNPDVGGALGGVLATTFATQVPQGIHAVWPVVTTISGQPVSLYLTCNTSPYYRSVCLTAAIAC
jgi:hypothetical protein